MFDGFLGTRASLIFDVLVVALALLQVVLVVGIAQARRGRYVLHRAIQTTLAVVLFVTVVVFEVDVRLSAGTDRDWRLAAAESPYAETLVNPSLYVHLAFAIATLVVWIVVVTRAWRNFPTPPEPSPHSRFHRPWAYGAAWLLGMTTLTGWLFYYLAFVA